MPDRYATPVSVQEFILQGGPATAFPTGGVGTYGFRIDDGQGATVVARTTSGIVEEGAGIYVATRTVPLLVGTYFPIWDNGAGLELTDGDRLIVAGSIPGGGGLVSVGDLDARGVEYATTEQAQAAIDDASAVARSYTAPILDAVESPDAPPAVVSVVIGMIRRVLTNPRGLAQETLGDYSYAAGANSVATLLPTARERRMLRQAAATHARANDLAIPSWGAGGVYQQADLPVASATDEWLL